MMRMTVPVARVGDRRGAYRFLVLRLLGKRNNQVYMGG